MTLPEMDEETYLRFVNRLENYCWKYQEDPQIDGLRTLREASKAMGLTLDDVEGLIDESNSLLLYQEDGVSHGGYGIECMEDPSIDLYLIEEPDEYVEEDCEIQFNGVDIDTWDDWIEKELLSFHVSFRSDSEFTRKLKFFMSGFQEAILVIKEMQDRLYEVEEI